MSLPDIETELVVWLNDGPLYGTGIEVSTRLPRDFEGRLYGTLRRAPGGAFVDPDTQWLEAGRLQLDTYGPTDVEAFATMAALADALGQAPTADFDNIVITSARLTQTAQWAPDPETDTPHYLAFAMIHAHPRPA